MQAPEISEDVVRRVISSLGFPAERVDRAVAYLLDGEGAGPVSRIMSFQEVLRVLSVSKSTLRRIVEAGDLKPIRITKRRIGFLADNVNAFIASLSVANETVSDNAKPPGP